MGEIGIRVAARGKQAHQRRIGRERLAISGQHQVVDARALQRALARLQWVVPAALAIIFLVIWLVFRRFGEVAIILLSLPLALVGGLWLIWMLGHAVSIATMIGFIALGGVAAHQHGNLAQRFHVKV